MPFFFATREHCCFGLEERISFTLSWKDAETGREWIFPVLRRTNYGRWGKRL